MADRDPSQLYESPVSGPGTAARRIGETATPVAPSAGVADIRRRDVMIRTGRIAGRYAGSVVRFARVLSTRGAGSSTRKDELVDKLKDFIRRHPSALAGAGAAGFVAGRLLRKL